MTDEPIIIVSGGQTGVDRAALDAALHLGVPCGGWCPTTRKAEDGTIPERYPLTPLTRGGYPARTRKNVEDSDATLIVTFGTPAGGTAQTIEFCAAAGRPVLVVDAAVTPVPAAVTQAVDFIKSRAIRRLNVAGPRASKQPKGYPYAYELIRQLLTDPRLHQ